MVARGERRQTKPMKFRFLSTGSGSAGSGLEPNTLKQMAADFVVVVAGILVALGVNDWHQERQELKIRSQHLSDLAAEIRSNIWTIDRIQRHALDSKRQNLDTVLRFLNDPHAPVENAEGLLHAFARSTIAATPWLSSNQFQAFQNSGDLRLLQDQELASDLAGVYAAPEVLFSQVRRIQGTYPTVVNELIPAQLQVEFSQLSGYVKSAKAPALTDDGDLNGAVERIRARRGELLMLARNEAAVTTAQWYALTRLRSDFEGVLTLLAQRDSSLASAGTAKH